MNKEYLEIIELLHEKCKEKSMLYSDLKTDLESITSSNKALRLITNRINFKKSKMLKKTIENSEIDLEQTSKKLNIVSNEIKELENKKKKLEDSIQLLPRK